MNVQGKRMLVVGLARSGFAVASTLARHGAIVTVTDSKPPVAFRDVLPQLLKQKIGVELGSQSVENFLRHDAVVISPGVPWDLPQLQAARERSIPIYPEVEAASWFLAGTLIGVTGSNGKTTTTALLGAMLKASGFPTFVGGNIGNALSNAVADAAPGTRFVTELSSFQLEAIRDFRPQVAVMLNLSPNHLDRHPSLEAYAEAKRRLFRNQTRDDYAVLNADDPWVAGLQATVPSQAVLFSRTRELPDGVFVSGDKVYYRLRHLERALFETRDVSLRGDFNLEDVLAAATAACLLGADFAAIRKAVREFRAVEHRLEFVQEIQGVDFYNNSKATSVDATVKSLGAFSGGVHLILGGKDKGAPYTPLLPLIEERVRDVLLIGAAAPIIAEQLAGSTELVQAGDLATAIDESFARARRGDTVLLAPACSSFDQFKDYEERGRVFKELVGHLASEVASGNITRGSRVAATPAPVPAAAAEPAAPVPLAIPDPASAESAMQGLESSPAAEAQAQTPPRIDLAPDASQPATTESSTAESHRTEAEPADPEPDPEPEAAELRRIELRNAPPQLANEGAMPEPPQESGTERQSVPRSELRIDLVDAPPRDATRGAPAAEEARHDLSATGREAVEPEPPSAGVEPRKLAERAATSERPKTGAPVASKADLLDRIDLLPAPAADREVAAIEFSTGPADKRDLPGQISTASGSVQRPASAPRADARPAPQHHELTYIYELDAVELSPADSQWVDEGEPEVYVLAGPPENVDDEILPFEVRAAVARDSKTRSAKSESAKNGAPSGSVDPMQSRLFGGGDKHR